MAVMNKIVVNFSTCAPAPSRGYNIKWRVAGTGVPYTNAGNFFVSPAIFYDEANPAGTCYEGFIRTDCKTTVGNMVPWESCIESGESGVIIDLPDEFMSFPGCGRAFGNEVNGVSEACVDAIVNNRTYWAGCLNIEIGCIVYTSHNMNVPLTGFNKMFIDGANWDIDPTNGAITGPSSVQC